MQQSSLIRQYRSDTSLIPDVNRTQSDRAAGHRPLLVGTQSEPALSQGRKPHPLLDDTGLGDPHTFNDLLVAAETLENIVMEGIHGTTAGAIRRFKGFGGAAAAGETKSVGTVGREMNDKILRLVYGTMKYLPYIDTILVKTQFLVYNNQFLNHLGIVKIMFYDLMRYHFDLLKFPGVDYKAAESPALKAETDRAELVQDLEESVRRHNVKLAAAFARIRIERRAAGDTVQEQMENILPEEVRAKELFAVEMPKTVRINFLKTTKEDVAEELRNLGYRVKTVPPTSQQLSNRIANNVKVEFIELDETFTDYFVIPSELFSEIKGSPPVTEGRLVFQDRASAYGIKHLSSVIDLDDHVIAARVGCGVTVCSMATMMKNKGKIFAFESRPSRLESLKMRLQNQNVQNVDVIESDFLSCDVDDEQFSKVRTIIVEPPTTGGAIVDKLGYLLQEEEFPNDQCTPKDLAALKRQQVNMLKHAFTFPNIKNIIYITRSTNREENEHVMQDVVASSEGGWELSCVLPDVVNEREFEWEMEECLKIRPSESGNGVFLSHLYKLPTESELQQLRDEEERLRLLEESAATLASSQTFNLSSLSLESDKSTARRGRKLRKKQRPESGDGKKNDRKRSERVSTNSLPRLSKTLSQSVNRLSVPRRRSPDSIGKSRGGNTKLSRHDSKHDDTAVDDDEEEEGGEESDAEEEGKVEGKKKRRKQGMRQFGFDFGVFGFSLKKFYAPKAIALQQIATAPVDLRWKYPIESDE
ncbi:hypothetical protein HDU67_005963 [Dinochytrium kinnereticum]|nr:hypothetical protein HDU67_005963 [Dinochytrium kinnereticum]